MKKFFLLVSIMFLAAMAFSQISHYAVEEHKPNKHFQVEFDLNMVYYGKVRMIDGSIYWAKITTITSYKGDTTKLWGSVPKIHSIILGGRYDGVNTIPIDPIPAKFEEIEEITITNN